MRTRLLLLSLLACVVAALLPVIVTAPATAADDAALTVRSPGRTVAVGEPLVVTARLSGIGRVDDLFVLQRVGRRWAWVDIRFSQRGDRLRIRIVPTIAGRHVYQVRVADRDGNRDAKDRFVIRAKLDPEPKVETTWLSQPGGRATLQASAYLNEWVPGRPRLALQQHTRGRWSTITETRGQMLTGRWGFWFNVAVSELGPLRVVGAGRGWRVVAPVAPYFVDAGRIHVDGRPVSLPADPARVRRLYFDADAGDALQVLTTANGSSVELLDPHGRVLAVGTDDHRFTTTSAGRYTVDVSNTWTPTAVVVARPQTAEPAMDGSPVVLPSVADARVARTVTFDAVAGEVVLAHAWTPEGPCGNVPTVLDITETGPVGRAVSCDTAGPVSVSLWRAKIFESAGDGEPIEVNTDRVGQPLALRFATSAPATTVALTTPWSGRDVLLRWPGSGHSDFWTPDAVVTYSAGPHVVVLRPTNRMSTPLTGTISLTQTAPHPEVTAE